MPSIQMWALPSLMVAEYIHMVITLLTVGQGSVNGVPPGAHQRFRQGTRDCSRVKSLLNDCCIALHTGCQSWQCLKSNTHGALFSCCSPYSCWRPRIHKQVRRKEMRTCCRYLLQTCNSRRGFFGFKADPVQARGLGHFCYGACACDSSFT